MNKDEFFTVEGTDAVGKGLQAKLLTERLISEGREVANFDFPQYSRPSAYFVGRYLRQEYGTLAEVGAKKASILYAVDRFDVGRDIKQALVDGKVVVSNRYVASNMAHQGGKFDDPVALQEFFAWLYDLEYGILGIPKPTLNIILYVSAEASQILLAKKGDREYLKGAKKDLHEKDPEHLRRSAQVYDALATQFPNEFVFINCMVGDVLMTPEAIHELVWQRVQPFLR